MLTIENLSKQYGAQRVLDGADLFVGSHDRVGLIGPNGVGKTTLLRLIAGLETPDGGTLRLDAHRSVGLLTQESQCRLGVTVREEMRSAFPEADAAQRDIAALAARLGETEGFAQREALRQLAQAQTDLEM